MTPTTSRAIAQSEHCRSGECLKKGSDQFEITRQEPKVDFWRTCYVFNAQEPQNATPVVASRSARPGAGCSRCSRPSLAQFTAAASARPYEVPADVMSRAEGQAAPRYQQIARCRRASPLRRSRPAATAHATRRSSPSSAAGSGAKPTAPCATWSTKAPRGNSAPTSTADRNLSDR